MEVEIGTPHVFWRIQHQRSYTIYIRNSCLLSNHPGRTGTSNLTWRDWLCSTEVRKHMLQQWSRNNKLRTPLISVFADKDEAIRYGEYLAQHCDTSNIVLYSITIPGRLIPTTVDVLLSAVLPPPKKKQRIEPSHMTPSPLIVKPEGVGRLVIQRTAESVCPTQIKLKMEDDDVKVKLEEDEGSIPLHNIPMFDPEPEIKKFPMRAFRFEKWDAAVVFSAKDVANTVGLDWFKEPHDVNVNSSRNRREMKKNEEPTAAQLLRKRKTEEQQAEYRRIAAELRKHSNEWFFVNKVPGEYMRLEHKFQTAKERRGLEDSPRSEVSSLEFDLGLDDI